MDYFILAWNNLVDFINSQETLRIVMANRFFLILLVIVLSSMKHASYSSMFVAALVNIPGTILHETAHFLVGLVFNAKPTSFSLFPRKSGGVYVMGSVGFRNITFYNALPAAMAPLLLLPIGFYLNRYFFTAVNISIWTYLVYILLQTIIIENSLPSTTDFRVGFKYISGVAICGALLILYLALFL